VQQSYDAFFELRRCMTGQVVSLLGLTAMRGDVSRFVPVRGVLHWEDEEGARGEHDGLRA
jgi:hypothetical protein